MNAHKKLLAQVAGATAFALVLTGAAASQEWTDPYAYGAGGGFDLEGLYVGVTGGANWDPSSSHLSGGDTAATSLGGAVGVNLYVTDTVIAGGEVQGSANIGPSGTTFDAFALGRLGVAPSENMMIYGALGPGWSNGSAVYGLGVGAEFAVTDNVGVRGEMLGVGTWGATPDAAKITAGALWHMD